MTTRIDRTVTEVVPQPEAPAETEGADPRFEELEQFAKMLRRHDRVAARTRAEGFDD